MFLEPMLEQLCVGSETGWTLVLFVKPPAGSATRSAASQRYLICSSVFLAAFKSETLKHRRHVCPAVSFCLACGFKITARAADLLQLDGTCSANSRLGYFGLYMRTRCSLKNINMMSCWFIVILF